jgi:hypothetical protein
VKRTPSVIEIKSGDASTCALAGRSVGQYCSIPKIDDPPPSFFMTAREFTRKSGSLDRNEMISVGIFSEAANFSYSACRFWILLSFHPSKIVSNISH